jgi:protein phosphatase 1 regulatory subunit 7
MLSRIKNVHHLVDLKEFWCNDNNIDCWSDIDQLATLRHLECVYLERNPIAQDNMYRRKVKMAIPHIKQIDATMT